MNMLKTQSIKSQDELPIDILREKRCLSRRFLFKQQMSTPTIFYNLFNWFVANRLVY